MPILSAQKLKLLFGEVEIFSDVSLEVNEHARIGIVGPNGGGKTSLLRMLLGELDSDAGAVIRGSSIRIGYVSQIPQSEAEGSLRDEIMTAFDDLIALEEGMPYQTLIASVLHKYVTGRFVDRGRASLAADASQRPYGQE